MKLLRPEEAAEEALRIGQAVADATAKAVK
jgi:hypothetical protein